MPNKENLLYFVITLFFTLIFCSSFLTGDGLRSFNQAEDLINFFFINKDSFDDLFLAEVNSTLQIDNPLMVFQNIIIILSTNFLEFFFNNLNFTFISTYLVTFLSSFYACFSFYVCFIFLKKNNSNFNSLIISFLIFFGTGLIYFFSANSIENLIILIFFLRYLTFKKKNLILIDLALCLIKPYLIIFVIYFNLFDEKKIFKKLKQNLFYLTILIAITFSIWHLTDSSSQKFILNNFINNELVALDLSVFFPNYFRNFIDIFFSNSSGILNTLLPIIILILFGFNSSTKYKLLTFLLFLLFLSSFNFWYSHLPMSGRYILSIIPFFLKEISDGFNFILKNKTRLIVKIFFLLLIVNLVFNLPTINMKNTSYINYSNNAYSTGNFNQIRNQNYHFHPINDYRFHQYLFNAKYYKSLILSEESFIFLNKKIVTKDIYPSLGFLRLKFFFQNLENIKDSNISNKIPVFITKFPYPQLLIYGINLILFILCLIFLVLNLIFLRNIFKK